mgnify:FL=1|tara:strand:+ start:4082 stop:4273 length:192 start_codon:yes stop_codon:yes gene_type:complete
MSNKINVHLNPTEVRLINMLVTNVMEHNPEFKKTWTENKTTKNLMARLDKAKVSGDEFYGRKS